MLKKVLTVILAIVIYIFISFIVITMFVPIFFENNFSTLWGYVVRLFAIAIYLFNSMFMIRNIINKKSEVVIKLYIITVLAIFFLQFILSSFVEPITL